MELQEFTQKFADCFNQTDASLIKPETEFKALEEWGSMLALIVIAMIDSDYGKTVSSEDLKNATTIASLFEIVSKK
jgi:acyl carrier protein